MKTAEDEAFEDIERRQGGGFPAKRGMAADKLHWSDCAVHNGPAYPAGPCDCGVAQEPVAWITPDGEGFRIRFSAPTNDVPLGWDALYTTPPKRPWVGLKPEEINAVDKGFTSSSSFYAGALWAQAKLKEKNT